MVVTDGSPETYEDIFEKYNSPRHDVSYTMNFFQFLSLNCPIVIKAVTVNCRRWTEQESEPLDGIDVIICSNGAHNPVTW